MCVCVCDDDSSTATDSSAPATKKKKRVVRKRLPKFRRRDQAAASPPPRLAPGHVDASQVIRHLRDMLHTDSSATTDSPNGMCASSAYESAVEEQTGIGSRSVLTAQVSATPEARATINDDAMDVSGVPPRLWRSCRGQRPGGSKTVFDDGSGVVMGDGGGRSAHMSEGWESSDSGSSVPRAKDKMAKRGGGRWSVQKSEGWESSGSGSSAPRAKGKIGARAGKAARVKLKKENTMQATAVVKEEQAKMVASATVGRGGAGTLRPSVEEVLRPRRGNSTVGTTRGAARGRTRAAGAAESAAGLISQRVA